VGSAAVARGVAPLVVALVIATLLARTRFAWLAIVGGYATMIALTTGFQFSPLTASRKILLLGLTVPVIGIAADLIPRPSRGIEEAGRWSLVKRTPRGVATKRAYYDRPGYGNFPRRRGPTRRLSSPA